MSPRIVAVALIYGAVVYVLLSVLGVYDHTEVRVECPDGRPPITRQVNDSATDYSCPGRPRVSQERNNPR